jgi:hypothetical protein
MLGVIKIYFLKHISENYLSTNVIFFKLIFFANVLIALPLSYFFANTVASFLDKMK